MLNRNLASAVLLTLLCVAFSAHAGRSCDNKPPTVQTIVRGITLAQNVSAALDASGA